MLLLNERAEITNILARRGYFAYQNDCVEVKHSNEVSNSNDHLSRKSISVDDQSHRDKPELNYTIFEKIKCSLSSVQWKLIEGTQKRKNANNAILC